MFKKEKEADFFELFVGSATFACEAGSKLLDLVEDFSNVSEKVSAIKDVEHQADDHTHTIYKELHKAFITPLEREDILMLNQALDNIVDRIDLISKLFYMFDIKTLRPDIVPIVKLIAKNCCALKDALTEFKNFKKSKILIDKIIEVNNIEEEGDALYAEAVRNLFTCGASDLDILKWYDIYKHMENCLDDCERVTNTMEDVILKNS